MGKYFNYFLKRYVFSPVKAVGKPLGGLIWKLLPLIIGLLIIVFVVIPTFQTITTTVFSDMNNSTIISTDANMSSVSNLTSRGSGVLSFILPLIIIFPILFF